MYTHQILFSLTRTRKLTDQEQNRELLAVRQIRLTSYIAERTTILANDSEQMYILPDKRNGNTSFKEHSTSMTANRITVQALALEENVRKLAIRIKTRNHESLGT